MLCFFPPYIFFHWGTTFVMKAFFFIVPIKVNAFLSSRFRLVQREAWKKSVFKHSSNWHLGIELMLRITGVGTRAQSTMVEKVWQSKSVGASRLSLNTGKSCCSGGAKLSQHWKGRGVWLLLSALKCPAGTSASPAGSASCVASQQDAASGETQVCASLFSCVMCVWEQRNIWHFAGNGLSVAEMIHAGRKKADLSVSSQKKPYFLHRYMLASKHLSESLFLLIFLFFPPAYLLPFLHMEVYLHRLYGFGDCCCSLDTSNVAQQNTNTGVDKSPEQLQGDSWSSRSCAPIRSNLDIFMV